MPYLERYERRVPLTEDEVVARALGITIRRAYRPRPKTAAFVRRIRTIATELFAARGLHAVSLADVSRAADLGPTHLAYYYGKREHLLYDILWDHIEGLLETANLTVARNQQAGDGPAWTSDLILSLLSDVTGTRRDAHRVLLHTLLVPPPVQRDALEQRVHYLRIALAQPLAPAAGLEWIDPRLAPIARALLAAIGETATWFPQHNEEALNAHANLLTAMALQGAGTAREANAPALQT